MKKCDASDMGEKKSSLPEVKVKVTSLDRKTLEKVR
jgi:hypothetical protein